MLGKGFLKFLLLLLLTVGMLCFCCSCATSSSKAPGNDIADEYSIVREIDFDEEKLVLVLQKGYANTTADENTYVVCRGYSSALDKTFSKNVITRLDWLKLLFEKLDIEIVEKTQGYEYIKDLNYFDGGEYYITAIENSVVYRGGTHFDLNSPATRQFVATTIVKGLDYDNIEYKLQCSDYDEIDEKVEASTAVYLRYLLLDDENCFNPLDSIAQEDADFILSQIDVVDTLRGKTVLSFGDSIMHGTGNDDVGVAELMAQRYQMEAIDYSKSGATFGKAPDREQIAYQIERAVEKGETADIILLNGGTNDMRNIYVGAISQDFEYQLNGREFFAQGMEYALGLLQDHYPYATVVYIRAHDMQFSLERNELHYGKTALDICEKWKVSVADVFKDTEFDAHDTDIKMKYTQVTKNCEKGDSVHPNRLGYYEYYIPLIVEQIINNLEDME